MKSKRDIKTLLLLIIILGIIYLNFYPTNPYSINNNNLKLGINSDILLGSGYIIGDMSPHSINGIKSADLDNDGNNDIITCSSEGKIHIWKNWGDPSNISTIWMNYLVGSTNGETLSIDVCDLDNDGYKDIVSSDQSGNNITIWQNDGNPFIGFPWNSQWVGDTLFPAPVVKFGDINGDCFKDIITGDNDGNIDLWWNNGSTIWNSSWDSTVVGEALGVVHTICLADLDNDLQKDIITGDHGNKIYGWRNPGAPWTIWNETELGDTGSADNINMLAVGDLENDGYIDIASADNGGDIVVWRNNGLVWRYWDSYTIDGSTTRAYFISISDLNMDGYLDIISGHDNGIFYVWNNIGSPWLTWNGLKVVNGTDNIDDGIIDFFSNSKLPDIVITTNSQIIIFPNSSPTSSNGGYSFPISLDTIIISISIIVAAIIIAVALYYHAKRGDKSSDTTSIPEKQKIKHKTP